MKLLSILFLFISSLAFNQTQFKGDWKLTNSNYKNHPFEQDTLTLEKVNDLFNDSLNNTDLLTLSEYGEAEYQSGLTTTYIDNATITNGSNDTINQQYENLKYLIYNDTLQLIFFNKYWPLTESEIRLLSKQELKNRFLNFGKSFLLYYKIILQTEKELKLVKLNLL
tara:strand:- start:27 stop:527 length:501 start_codon:yes stop_codon:yes gene_type:complete